MSYEQALDALARSPDGPEVQEQAFELRLRAGYERYQLGDPGGALNHWRRAEGAARTEGDERRMARLTAARAYALCMSGRYGEALEAGEQAVAAARDIEHRRLEAYAWTALSTVHYALGHYQRSVECACDALAALDVGSSQPGGLLIGVPPEVDARAWRTMSLARIGDFVEAVRWGEEAVAIAEGLDDPRSRVSAYHSLGTARVAKGDFDEAVALFEAALDVCEGRPLAWYASRALAALAFTYALSGDLPRALPLLERAVADAASSGVILDQARALGYVADTLLWAGRRTEAQKAAEQGLELNRLRGERGDEAWALEVLGEVATEGTGPALDEAIEHFEASLALAEQLGMHSLRARCHLGLGRAHGRAGRPAESRVELARAAETFRALGMTSWLARTEAASVGA
jgi:tetratricopeptide (TPR) repeat protein